MTFYKILRNAIVTIVANYVDEAKTVRSITATGFLILKNKKLYIVTNAHNVLESSVAIPMTTIFAGIYNINGSCINLTYELEIVGVDGLADVAILKIKDTEQMLPYYKKHPYITFEDSHRVKTGDKIFNISSPLEKDLQSYTQSTIRDPQWFGTRGLILEPCLVTSLLCYPSSSGSPVLNSKNGKCVGIVSFGVADDSDVKQIGFCGGCDSHTMMKIVDNILCSPRQNTNVVNNYLTNLKAYLGKILYVVASPYFLTTMYPNNYQNLQLRGFIMTQTSLDSPFSRLLKNKPPLQIGDIVVWAKHNGKKYQFGIGEKQVPLGNLLWFINPQSHNTKVKFGVIRNPNTNSKIEKVCTLLNQTIDPANEYPPQNGLAETITNPCLPLEGLSETFATLPVQFATLSSISPPSLYTVIVNSPQNQPENQKYNVIIRDSKDNAQYFAARRTPCGTILYNSNTTFTNVGGQVFNFGGQEVLTFTIIDETPTGFTVQIQDGSNFMSSTFPST